MQQCDYKSKTEVEMHQHKVRIHESKQSSEIFNCDFCYYTTSTLYELIIHEHKTQRTNTRKWNINKVSNMIKMTLMEMEDNCFLELDPQG